MFLLVKRNIFFIYCINAAVTRSSESEEASAALTTVRSTNPNTSGDPTLDDMLSGRLNEDPVLYGVSQMLSILKQHVAKPKVK